MDSNPFAILTFIAAPAVLTNAASILTLGTSNRFGRNVDRARALIKLIENHRNAANPSDAMRAEDVLNRKLLGLMDERTALLMRAMSLFYFAIGCFAGGSLTSLLGAIIASTDHPYALNSVLIVALIAGVAGLAGLICAGALLVRETRLALRTIREEMYFYRNRFVDPT
jgi:hypothetical protein